MRAVKIAGIFAKNKTGEVRFEIDSDGGQIMVYSKAEEVGDNKTVLQSQISGPKQEIIFNPRYIVDGVQTIPTRITSYNVCYTKLLRNKEK